MIDAARLTSNTAQSAADDLAARLQRLFDQCFFARYNTRLVRGREEPIYLPASEHCRYHQIVFAHGFAASAMHEIAHWCIAGEQRRLQVDYGYWYQPDGRDQQQQQLFQAVEVKPQALEWLFSRAAAMPFRLSLDNLSGDAVDPQPFADAVVRQVHYYCEYGLPARAQLWLDVLQQQFTDSQQCQPLLQYRNFQRQDLLS